MYSVDCCKAVAPMLMTHMSCYNYNYVHSKLILLLIYGHVPPNS